MSLSLEIMVVYMKFPKVKRGPCICFWGKWVVLRQFRILHLQQTYIFLKNFDFTHRVHVTISRQMKCETYGIFKSFFNLKVLCGTPNLFCPFDHLPTFAAQRTYFICLYSLTLNLTWWVCNEKTTLTYTYSKVGPCLWQIRCFNSTLGPTALSVYFQTIETWTLV